jgi:hypothetical protein
LAVVFLTTEILDQVVGRVAGDAPVVSSVLGIEGVRRASRYSGIQTVT